MSVILRETIDGYRAAGEAVALARDQATRAPVAVQSAEAERSKAKQKLSEEVMSHPELSEAAKAGWLAAIYATGYGWKAYEELDLEARADLFATRLEEINGILLEPGQPVLYAMRGFQLEPRGSVGSSIRRGQEKIPATNLFRMGISDGKGLQLKFPGAVPVAHAGVDSLSTPSTYERSGFNSWEIPLYSWISESYCSTGEISSEAHRDIYGENSILQKSVVIVGSNSFKEYLEEMLKYRNECVAKDKVHATAYARNLDEVFIRMWQEAKALGISMEELSPVIAAEVESRKQEFLVRHAAEISYDLFEHHHVIPEKLEVSPLKIALGIDPEDLRAQALVNLNRRFDEVKEKLASLSIGTAVEEVTVE